MKTKNRGYIYVFRVKNFYKIGLTNNVSKRLSTCRVYNPFGVDLIISKEFNNARKAENILHCKFRNKREKGEWFKLSLKDLRIIENYSEKDLITDTLLFRKTGRKKKAKNFTVSNLRQIICLSQKRVSPHQIAKEMGMNAQTVNNLLKEFSKVEQNTKK